MATNSPFALPDLRVTATRAQEAIEIKRCLVCKCVLGKGRSLPVCVKHAAGINRDNDIPIEQIIAANERDSHRLIRRTLRIENDTSHIMSLPKKVQEQAKRKEFHVPGLVRLTRRVLIDNRK